jgi:hypothetical protein
VAEVETCDVMMIKMTAVTVTVVMIVMITTVTKFPFRAFFIYDSNPLAPEFSFKF